MKLSEFLLPLPLFLAQVRSRGRHLLTDGCVNTATHLLISLLSPQAWAGRVDTGLEKCQLYTAYFLLNFKS